MTSGGMYDSGFETYKNVTPDEYRSVLRTGVVILDANVLLHLYRYHPGTRKDLMDILTAIKGHLWIPHQAMHEFWQGRPGVIVGRSKEIEDIVGGLQNNGLQMGDGIRYWANRIGLPPRERQRLLDRVESTIDHISNRIRALSAADSTEDVADTDSDPILSALEPILDGSVGRPLSPEVAREAKKEALQRIADKRAPGWKDAAKKENKEGDYFVWLQSLQEAKQRGLDVLFVTDDAKPDWWRIEHGETKGPLPELVHEMRQIANVRLFMTRPETLLLHARDILGKDVSSDSIRDVQRVSSQVDTRSNSESIHIRYLAYEHRVMAAMTELGYHPIRNVTPTGREFDLLIGDRKSRRIIYAELKHYSHPIPRQVIHQIMGMAGGSPLPIILISNVALSESAQDALEGSQDILKAITWKDDTDTRQLGAALEETFLNLPG
jgi:PIN domain-containing protein